MRDNGKIRGRKVGELGEIRGQEEGEMRNGKVWVVRGNQGRESRKIRRNGRVKVGEI